ncbi:YT521-B-like domain-containing protein [Cadophora sp. MPI-SDFR-AT-0126]|nr:YT521-B-like domain-containing protein [Leotiomycetes sp. MPI-SDFR-AT-0126]
MWHNNGGFSNNSQFQNSFNQDGYPPSPFAGQPVQGQQYFPQQPNMTQVEDSHGDSFQPGGGLFNDRAFMQNQFNSQGPPQFSPPPFNMQQAVAPPPRPPTQINARAAELKAELLKRREGRTSSATPPVLTNLAQATKQATRENGSSSLRASPKTPITTSEKLGQELNLNELISQYSESKPAAPTAAKQELVNSNTSSIQKPPVHMEMKSQVHSLGSPMNTTKQVNPGDNTTEVVKQFDENARGKSLGKRHTSNGSVSEGEILEDRETNVKATTTATRAKPREAQSGADVPKIAEAVSRSTRDERIDRPFTRPSRDESPFRRPPANSTSLVQRNRDDRREDFDTQVEKRTYQPDYRNERNQYADSERPAYQRQEMREEDHRRPNLRPDTIEPKREEVINNPFREQKPPTLEDLLPLNRDLREWLEITGYHNTYYRNKILNRRRAIAALDAQRDRLLAEMEADERGGVPAIAGGQVPPSPMLPPPIPNKVGSRSEAVAAPFGDVPSALQLDRVMSNKRPYSDVGDQRSEVNGGAKIARTDDRGYQPQRIKEEDRSDYHRPRSSGFDTSRRSPPFERRERDTSRPRYESRGRSRERESSPGPSHRVFESRPPARGRGYDSVTFYDGEEVERGRGAYEHRGGYKGRAYDPNYRGRGRGRGRGDSRDGRDGRDVNLNSDVKMESGFGSKIANGKPFKDPKGFDRGGRGETRYFIVKSFNEENVLRCIQDSVWTTQVQNGSIFKEAFETCKNVILVFSINKSRAFQGYARMESPPGSVESPEWQSAINWESAGAFRVRWLVICSTRFHRIGHLKNALNDNLAVLIGKDGQEIEENCGARLIELIDEEANLALGEGDRYDDRMLDDYY